eukprot:TRINITY_DN4854_c0_g2_i1.p1 TRINITY_DN4854_c0_g2~~TRINITY_DN4854_c0_g2_i1.p1  ORF type:complete len:769 (-),score=139.53 TRINITY_DN4854_c0_g2_i1:107-2413(-)
MLQHSRSLNVVDDRRGTGVGIPGQSKVKDDLRTELRIIIEHGFSMQKEWLEKRLQHHESRLLHALQSSDSMVERPLEKDLPQLEGMASADLSQGRWPPKDRANDPEDSSTSTCEPVKTLPGQVVIMDPQDDAPILRQAAIAEVGEEGNEELHELIAKLEDMFDSLDSDGSGTISRVELRRAFQDVGIPPIVSIQHFIGNHASNMEIDRLEWLHMIEDASRDDMTAFMAFAKKLIGISSEKGSLCDQGQWPKLPTFVRHDSKLRMIWDMTQMLLLFWVSLSMPFSMGFGEFQELKSADLACDILFLLDVAINFFTTYIDRDEIIVTNNRRMALHYLRTWFVLDFVSSVPWDLVTAGLLPSLQAARLLKVGKVAKVFKLMRLGKLLRAMASSEVIELMEDHFSPKASQTASRVFNLVLITGVTCHWLACFLAVSDQGCLDDYFASLPGSSGEATSVNAKYVATLYWAVTTLTTVGYGDIIPLTDQERTYVMAAMLIGSAFFGYIIGCITSVITDMDIDKRTFNERMEVVQAWLEFHDRMPAVLRRRIRRHFKELYRNRTIADDATIVSELSGMLRADTAYFIIHEKVRTNPTFRGLPGPALASLVCVLKKSTAKPEENIIVAGDPGTAMYCVVEGQAYLALGNPWLPAEYASTSSVVSKEVKEGESFGEEVVFSLEQIYHYTVTARTAVTMYELPLDTFKYRFKHMPDLTQKMLTNFLRSKKVMLKAAGALPAEPVSAPVTPAPLSGRDKPHTLEAKPLVESQFQVEELG